MATLNVSTDYQVFDGLETVLYGRGDLSAIGTWTNVLRRELTTREVEASNGVYRAGDLRLTVPNAVLGVDGPPQIGDRIAFTTELSTVYLIVTVDRLTMGSRFRCVVRRPELGTIFDRTVNVLIDRGNAQDEMGAPVPQCDPVYQGVRASIHPVDVTERDSQSRRMLPQEVRIVLETAYYDLGPQHWIEDGNTMYRIVAVEDRETVGALPVFRAVQVTP